jgi:hypothetical protein
MRPPTQVLLEHAVLFLEILDHVVAVLFARLFRNEAVDYRGPVRR